MSLSPGDIVAIEKVGVSAGVPPPEGAAAHGDWPTSASGAT